MEHNWSMVTTTTTRQNESLVHDFGDLDANYSVFLESLGEEDEMPEDLPAAISSEQESFEIAMFLEAETIKQKIRVNEARKRALVRQFEGEAHMFEQRLERVYRAIRMCVEARESQGLGRTIRIPGIGEAGLTKAGGRWRVTDKDEALKWLESVGQLDDTMIKKELMAKPVLSRIEEIIDAAGGEVPVGFEKGEKYDSFRYKSANEDDK